MSFVGNIKWCLADLVESHPFSYYVVKKLFHVLPVLLPHDHSFFAFKHLAQPGAGLFLDVGANDGISALSFRRMNSSYSILSIEASPYHEPSLKGVKKRLQKFDYLITGAGAEPAELTLHTPIYRGVPIHSAASLRKAQAQTLMSEFFSPRIARRIHFAPSTVKVIRLDTLNLAPSIIKIDVEGFDDQVFLGLKETIVRHRPYIMVENNPTVMPRIRKFCEDLDYGVYSYQAADSCFCPFDGAVSEDGMWAWSLRNVFCIPNDKRDGLPIREPARQVTPVEESGLLTAAR